MGLREREGRKKEGEEKRQMLSFQPSTQESAEA